MRYSRRQGNYNDEIKRKIGKINLSCFDGFGYTSTGAWVHKADTYFQLNLMLEEEAIKFATLHLEGIAHGGTMRWSPSVMIESLHMSTS